MKYMGSKIRFIKELTPILLKDRQPDQWYIEPFAGGMNVIASIDGLRLANDNHYYLIEMWKKLVSGWIPDKITKSMYIHVRDHKDEYPAYYVGWVGFNCSYSGKYFAGFAGDTKTKINTIRDYQQEAINNVLKQVRYLQDVVFENREYYNLNIPNNSIVYCDPPYYNTTAYASDFDHNMFWEWVRYIHKHGNKVYVSEYVAPDDFTCIWEKQAISSLSANGVYGSSKLSTERLFSIV